MPEFIEPWVARAWAFWDLRAALGSRDMAVKPLDLAAMPARERDILPEWIKDWDARQKAAMDAAKSK